MKTKATALLLVALMLLTTLSGCQSKAAGYILAVDGDEVPVGVYIYYQMTAAYEAVYLVDNPYDEIWNQMIDDVTAEQWIKNKALDDAKRMVAVERMFDNMGLSLSDEDQVALDNAVSSEWNESGGLYERNGIARTSIYRVAESLYKQRTLFESIYGAEGTEPIDRADLASHFREDYARLAYLLFFPEAEGGDETEGESADSKTERDPDEDATDTADGDEATEPDNTDTGDTDTGNDSLTESQQARRFYERALAGEDFSALIDEYEADLDDDFDPDDHDHDHFFLLYRENAGQYPAGFIDQLFETPFGEVGYYEDEYYIFVFVREDPMEDEATFEELDYTLRYSLYESVFEARLSDSLSDLAITESAAAIKKFIPTNLQFS